MLETTQKLIEALSLENDKLPIEDKAALTAVLLRKIDALPITNKIIVDKSGIYMAGRTLEAEEVISLKDSAIALNDNYARRIIKEQIQYLAIMEGVHKGLNTEQIIFSKAALWIIEQEQRIISEIVMYASGYHA